MLVLLSMALVLIATVLLVLGLLNDDGLNLIYLSILSSLAAFGVLLFALRANRSRTERRPALPEALADLEPAREPATVGAAAGAGAAVTAVHTSPAPAVAASSTSGSQGEWHASDLDDWSEPTAGADDVDDAEDEVEDGWQEGDEVEFPIADYDSLTVGQILPLLPQLYSDEFDVVEERERATKARPQVLAKLAELRDGGVSADPLASYTEPVATEADEEEEEWFPIEDYESLSAAQIQPLLPELDEEELELVRTRELELGRRRSLLDEIDRLLGDAPAAPAPAPTPATSKAAAAKAPAGSASRKAPAKRASSTSSTKKAAAKKAATKRSAPTKQTTTAKKASATKAPAKKAPASKRATASKKAAPAKQAATKASSAKPAVAKKPTAKKTTAKKTAAKKAAAPAKKAAKATKRSTKR